MLESLSIRLNSPNTSAALAIGRGIALAKRVTDTEGHYRAALLLRPNDPEAHHNLALLLRKCGGDSEADEHFALAKELRPSQDQFRSSIEAPD